jgi:hypothetical protein
LPRIDVTAAFGTCADKLPESPDGGWGINGRAYLNAEIADTARKILAGG